jgi:hypothetical protein
MRTNRLLALLVVLAALPLGACYADVAPAPYYGGGAYYGRPAPPVVVYHGNYQWHAYGRVR